MKTKFFKPETSFESKKRLSEEDQVIVRVWLPKINKKETNAFKVAHHISNKSNEQANIGHTTVQTPSYYASMWPNQEDNLTDAFKLIRAEYNTLVDDELSEGGTCDLLICLYSLNVKEIDNAFTQVKATGVGYVLAGDSSVAEKGGHSCCSLAYHLLRAGGVEKLDASRSSTMASLVITPDNFADFLKAAKLKELEMHPETMAFNKLEGEVIPEKSSYCLVC